MHIKSFYLFVFLTLFLSNSSFSNEFDKARELEPDLKRGKEVYLVCTTCHKPEGWGSTSGVIPQVSGQHFHVLISQLKAINEGDRHTPQMKPFASVGVLGGAQGIADVAAYMNSLPMTAKPEHGNGSNLSHGSDSYTSNCGRCHGKNGEGDDDEDLAIPKIQGQHYNYLFRQMKWIRDGQRKNSDRKMVKKMKNLPDEELEALADYVSRLKPELGETQ